MKPFVVKLTGSSKVRLYRFITLGKIINQSSAKTFYVCVEWFFNFTLKGGWWSNKIRWQIFKIKTNQVTYIPYIHIYKLLQLLHRSHILRIPRNTPLDRYCFTLHKKNYIFFSLWVKSSIKKTTGTARKHDKWLQTVPSYDSFASGIMLYGK